MGQALYRKYRSKSLDEIVGQSHITDILRRAIATDRVAHAYLLTGPKGVGKTSIARILAHEINNLPYTEESTHLDIVEIDAASNNGVDDIRDLRDKVQIAPTSARKKVYIIDEVHMLSKPAFNALLKTLEEPPEHVVFILATTDADKLPATIISRVQRFNFRTITTADAAMRLRAIAHAEKIDISDEALQLIAHHGSGSLRDSTSLLDQLQNISDGPINRELIESVLGLADADTVEQLLAAHEAGDLATIVQLIDNSESRGTPAAVLAEQLVHAVRLNITARPQLLPLLDKLLDISRSAWPGIKLLTSLADSMSNASTSVHTPEVAPAKPKHLKATAPSTSTTPEPVVEQAKNQTDPTEIEFPWTDFLSAVKSESIGAATLLAKCGYSYTTDHLTVYAGKSFNKTQLEKSLASIRTALQQVGIEGAGISILAKLKPASNSKTAAVLDIMGGGEEVKL